MLACLILGTCTCKNLVNKDGIGNCEGTKSVAFGKVACYVNQPSSCSDLKNSGTNPGEKYSAVACDQKGI